MDKSKEVKLRKAVLLISDVCQQQLKGQQRVQTLISELIMLLDECFGEEHATEILNALTDNSDGFFQPRGLVFTLRFSLIARKIMSKKVKFSFNMMKCIFKEFKRESALNPSQVSEHKIRSFFSSPEPRKNDTCIDENKSCDLVFSRVSEADADYSAYKKKRTKEMGDVLKNQNEKLIKEKTFLDWRNKMMMNKYKWIGILNNCIKIFKRCLGKHFGKFLIGGKARLRSKSALCRLIKKADIKKCQSLFKVWKKTQIHLRNKSDSSKIQQSQTKKWNLYNARKVIAGLEQALFYFFLEKAFTAIIGRLSKLERFEKPLNDTKHQKIRASGPNHDEKIGAETPSFKTSTIQNQALVDFGASPIESSSNKLSFSQLSSISIFGYLKSDNEDLSKTIGSFNPDNESSRSICDESSLSLFGPGDEKEIKDIINTSNESLEKGEIPKKEDKRQTPDNLKVPRPPKNIAKLRRNMQSEKRTQSSPRPEREEIKENSADSQEKDSIKLEMPKKPGGFAERNREKRNLRALSQTQPKKSNALSQSPKKEVSSPNIDSCHPVIENNRLSDSIINLPAQAPKTPQNIFNEQEKKKTETLPFISKENFSKPSKLNKVPIEAVSEKSDIESSKDSSPVFNQRRNISKFSIFGPINSLGIKIADNKTHRRENLSFDPSNYTPYKEKNPFDSIESIKTADTSPSQVYTRDSSRFSLNSVTNHTEIRPRPFLVCKPLPSKYADFDIELQESVGIQSKIIIKIKKIQKFSEVILRNQNHYIKYLKFNNWKNFTEERRSDVRYWINCLFEALILNVLKDWTRPLNSKSPEICSFDSIESLKETEFIKPRLLQDDPFYDEKKLFRKKSAQILALAIKKIIKQSQMESGFDKIAQYSSQKKRLKYQNIKEKSLLQSRYTKPIKTLEAKACFIILNNILQPKFKKTLKCSFDSIRTKAFTYRSSYKPKSKRNSLHSAGPLLMKLSKIFQLHSINDKKKSFRVIYSYAKNLKNDCKVYKFINLLQCVFKRSQKDYIYAGFSRIYDKSERARIYKYVKIDYFFKKVFIRRLANAFVVWVSNSAKAKEIERKKLNLSNTLQRRSGNKADLSWTSCFSSHSTSPMTSRARGFDVNSKNMKIFLPFPKSIHDYIDDFNEVSKQKIDASYFTSPGGNSGKMRI
ncbi:unnamed protein product [Blepharisma stoltei]|uniref:Uncharacterized protein n=1 Tax=Blepharisma stoltei TaxID=1481888 RepID=A0AAU9JKE6_9CILI|nr:unnamed protein product [Blepharisma stoltei]